jgi:uncharacterized protein YdbL (DUF1318 family)
MKSILRGIWLLGIAAVVSCVTINIYFPAEEIRGAADRIVDEVYGEKAESSQPAPAQPGSSLIPGWGPHLAYAAQDINVTTPEIRAIRADMKTRFDQLEPYLAAGNVGIAADGLLAVRSQEGLNLKQRAEVSRLVDAENKDRLRLYQEIARANGFPEKAGEVQAIFADSWRDKAAKGWYLQTGGSWQRK